MLREFNFDGLIGPTHNFAGLSYGNVASSQHRNQDSCPRAAALQGLAKMKRLAELGVGQAVLPPLRRPDVGFLHTLGFSGSTGDLLDQAFRSNPVLLATAYSASNMWTANAATVSSSFDCSDDRLHLTVANLASTLHRSIEPIATLENLRRIFSDEDQFCVHPALPSQAGLSDEGAANHTRLCPLGFESESAGLELFVYGVDPMASDGPRPVKFPARQTRLASETVTRIHGLDTNRFILLQQNPVAIDAGVFHNDVIAVGNQNVLLVHELAFFDQRAVLSRIRAAFQRLFNQPMHIVEFSVDEISLADAVSSYLFNSQLITRPDGGMTLVCPTECEQIAAAKRCTERLLSDENPIDDVLFLDLRQSMNNGGGPACLRLRVPLTSDQQRAIHPGVVWNQQLHDRLVKWVQQHYRETLRPDDLRDPQLAEEANSALDALESILDMEIS